MNLIFHIAILQQNSGITPVGYNNKPYNLLTYCVLYFPENEEKKERTVPSDSFPTDQRKVGKSYHSGLHFQRRGRWRGHGSEEIKVGVNPSQRHEKTTRHIFYEHNRERAAKEADGEE